MTDDGLTGPSGWAFLVARGRRQGYRSILVPDFLAEAGEYGLLDEVVHGDVPASSGPRIEHLASSAAGRLTLAYRTSSLTYADLGRDRQPAGGDAAKHGPGDIVVDEHGRPLELLYGFVSPAPGLRQADETDLRTAREEALRAYRRFLTDEDSFTVQLSAPFRLLSVVDRPAEPILPAPDRRPGPPPLDRRTGPPPLDRRTGPPPLDRRPPEPPITRPPRDRRSTALKLVIAALLLAIVAVAAILLSNRGGDDEADIDAPRPTAVLLQATVARG
jgi:hypothetical protein